MASLTINIKSMRVCLITAELIRGKTNSKQLEGFRKTPGEERESGKEGRKKSEKERHRVSSAKLHVDRILDTVSTDYPDESAGLGHSDTRTFGHSIDRR
ncbi:hypothetical protein PoB_002553200 [Plakobranchus ocellatus]|uniref:Uncharacterized protein n=1 Tax=Plakobranchus ocellatus TaxID=259542 RepID=A0AAV3ZWF7_9GAST|nr:hypothetical protein PoB_002553200 [Plakobranchus ocellatus]